MLNIGKNTGIATSIEGYFLNELENKTTSFDYNPLAIYECNLKLTYTDNEINDEGYFMLLKNQKRFYDIKTYVRNW